MLFNPAPDLVVNRGDFVIAIGSHSELQSLGVLLTTA
jgi:K+/H+ antiporter YhaU regulatory subunit KhtT